MSEAPAARDPVAEAEARLDAGLHLPPPTVPSVEWDIMGHPVMPDDSLLGRIADLEEEADAEHAAAKAASAAARPADEDEDEIYVLLDFNGAEMPPGTKITGEMKVEHLDSDAPIIHLGDHIMVGKFEEDASSTLVFDRNALKRTAEARDRALHDLVFEETQGDDPLVCVTTKRLRLEPAIAPIEQLMKNYAQRAAHANQAAAEQAQQAAAGGASSSSSGDPAAAQTAQNDGVVV